tara:strand:- start:310 stop:735 length:426 start_codon:yes stop_codon:yes gene_type:complete
MSLLANMNLTIARLRKLIDNPRICRPEFMQINLEFQNKFKFIGQIDNEHYEISIDDGHPVTLPIVNYQGINDLINDNNIFGININHIHGEIINRRIHLQLIPLVDQFKTDDPLLNDIISRIGEGVLPTRYDILYHIGKRIN